MCTHPRTMDAAVEPLPAAAYGIVNGVTVTVAVPGNSMGTVIGLGDGVMADRLISLLLFGIAYLCGVAAMLMLLVGFVDWLQTGRWARLSLLELGYHVHLIPVQWFLANPWSWWLHDALQAIPVYAALLGFAPLAWVFGAWMGSR